jgi:hypothetical protein
MLRYLGALFGNFFLKGYATDDSDQRVGYILDFFTVQITYVGMLLRVRMLVVDVVIVAVLRPIGLMGA